MKILVVDDSTVTRRILVHALAQAGYTDVVQAVDGQQATERCTPDVDVVLTDWNMPNRSGIELARYIHGRPDLAHIHVFMVTSRNDVHDIVEAAAAGVTEFIVKPIVPEIIREKLERCASTPEAKDGTEG